MKIDIGATPLKMWGLVAFFYKDDATTLLKKLIKKIRA